MVNSVFSDFSVQPYTGSSVKVVKDEQKNEDIKKVTSPELTKKEKIINTAKKIAPVVIPLAAIPLTALITYKLSSKNIKYLNNKIETLSLQVERAGKNAEKISKALEETGKSVATQTEKVAKLDNKVAKIVAMLAGGVGTYQFGKNAGRSEDEKSIYYKNIINDSNLPYDPLTPPVLKTDEYSIISKDFPFKDLSDKVTPKTEDNYINNLINQLNKFGEINIPLSTQKHSDEEFKKASIDNINSSDLNLGQFIPIGMSVKYGKRTNWSNEKISRDILQNFYDANNHTLDGVGFSIIRDGEKYRVKITGSALFDCKELLELGSGNKSEESPYNAGGFGEGSRLVVASLLGQDKVENIKFSSADWKLTFNQKDGSIRRMLEKTSECIDGNYIEFETNDRKFTESLIKSLNYFNSSNNGDYQNLNYDSKDFGFKILYPRQSGNLYMTQRFEYGADNKWDNGLEGLTLIFKRKPDAQKFYDLTKKDFSKGRDRIYYTGDDIFDLTRYFAKDMSDSDLIDAILLTKDFWTSSRNDNKRAIDYFINGLCKEANARRIGINFENEKYCITDCFSNNAIIDYVKNMGYKVISSGLSLNMVGMPTVSEIKDKSSAHKPLKPTDVEIKKIKLLDEAARVIQESIKEAYTNKSLSLYTELKDKYTDGNLLVDDYTTRMRIAGYIIKHDTNSEFVKKYGSKIIDDPQQFTKDLFEYLDNIIWDNDKKLLFGKIIKEMLPEESEERKELKSDLDILGLILDADINMPRYIFDSNSEISTNTLGEAIIDTSNFGRKYMGHWIDRTYLNKGDFYDLLATWLHEMSHKTGGDGSSTFTYALTDLIQALIKAGVKCDSMQKDLSVIEKLFNTL